MGPRTYPRGTLLLILALVVATPTPTESQLTVLSGAGYAATGLALGVAATSGADCEGFICIPSEMVVASIVGVGAGTWLGVSLGRGAEEAVRAGTPAPHLWALSTGVVLGGATLGLLVANQLVDEGSSRMEDRTLAVGGLAGAALAAWYLQSRWDELTGRAFRVTPALIGGRVGSVLSLRF